VAIKGRKLGISFWEYLQNRVFLTTAIPPLPMLIRNAVVSGALPWLFERFRINHKKVVTT